MQIPALPRRPDSRIWTLLARETPLASADLLRPTLRPAVPSARPGATACVEQPCWAEACARLRGWASGGGGVPEAGRAAPRNSDSGRRQRDLEGFLPRPRSNPPAGGASHLLRAAGRRKVRLPSSCSPAVSARPAGRRAQSTAARGQGPRPRHRRLHQRQSVRGPGRPGPQPPWRVPCSC